GERAVAVVVVKDAATVLREIEVGKAIAIIVPYRCPHAVPTTSNLGFFGDVGKGSVSIVVIQCVFQRWIRVEKIAAAAVHQIDVHPAIIVIIQEGTASSGSFRKIIV